MIDPNALKEVEDVFKHFRKIGASHEQASTLTLAYAHLKATQDIDVEVKGEPHMINMTSHIGIKPGDKVALTPKPPFIKPGKKKP